MLANLHIAGYKSTRPCGPTDRTITRGKVEAIPAPKGSVTFILSEKIVSMKRQRLGGRKSGRLLIELDFLCVSIESTTVRAGRKGRAGQCLPSTRLDLLSGPVMPVFNPSARSFVWVKFGGAKW